MRTQQDICAITEQDGRRVVAVWEAAVRATHHFLTEADIQAIKPLVWDELIHLETLSGVRDGDGQVVGFIGVEGVEIAALFIHPAWRGQGLGRRMLTYAVETLGAVEVEVNEQNEQAVGFYQRMGFEVAGRSEDDGQGRPFPLLRMRLCESEETLI
jgi:putative acetyltransferase